MPIKPLTAYLETPPSWWADDFALYQRSPATAFLSQTVHLADSVNHCLRHFKKKVNGSYTKDSQDSLYRLSAAALAAIMGQFEMFQRFFFAGVLEITRFVPTFDIDECCKRLAKGSGLSIEPSRLLAYRGRPAPIGQVVADNLVGWHDPARVNAHFAAVVPDTQLYSSADCQFLRVLWQFRHSIVHTAGWLTHPDAQKVKELNSLGGTPLVLGQWFVNTVARKFHPIVVRGTGRLKAKVLITLPEDLKPDEQQESDHLFETNTPRRSFLPRKATQQT